VKLHRTHDFAHRASSFRLRFTRGLPRNACGVSRLPLVSCRDVEFHVCPREDYHPLAIVPVRAFSLFDVGEPFLWDRCRLPTSAVPDSTYGHTLERHHPRPPSETCSLAGPPSFLRLRDEHPILVRVWKMRHPQRAETILPVNHPFRDELLTASEAGHWKPSLARRNPKPIRADRAELKELAFCELPLLEPCRTPPCR